MPPIITLLTDFGQADSYVAELKAAVIRIAPAALLVDITHHISQGDLRAAQYLLGRSWCWFPDGTVHVSVVDPGVGTARRALAASVNGHTFLGPDNGLLTPVLDGASVIELVVPQGAAPTFHGRDVFAPAAARLALGEELSSLGEPVSDPVRLPVPTAREQGGSWVGEVIYIDIFGTLITNLDERTVVGAEAVSLPGGQVAPVRRTFCDVELGALVAFIGSGGTLEIAARDTSAARMTGAGVGAEVRVEYGSVADR